MAQITFTVNDADVPRIVSAFEFNFGAKGGGETNAEFVKRHIISTLNNWVRQVVSQKAREDAVDAYVDLDIV